MVSGVVGELRALYKKGDFEGVVSRVEQLQQRQRGAHDTTDRPILSAARAAALIHLGRPQAAAAVVQELSAVGNEHPAYAAVAGFAHYAQAYIAWSSNQAVANALSSLNDVDAGDSSNTQALKAQLLYRLGRYGESAGLYRVMHDEAKQAYDDAAKSQPTATKSWSLTGRRAAPIPQLRSESELKGLKQTQNEIATNLMAALVLAGLSSEALALGAGVGKSYEAEYNNGCASISAMDWSGARKSLEEAERLYKSLSESETEEEVIKGLAPIIVQRAYVGHVAGEVATAEKEYTSIVRDRKADSASLAVAANNAAVAKGQLALGKQQTRVFSKSLPEDASSTGSSPIDDEDKRSVAKDRNAILFDALKKMKATSGREVERKLTLHQRRAMARNRAILLVQMGRLDACRSEVDKLKANFPDDALVPLVEAALVAKNKTPAEADLLLKSSSVSDTDVRRGARVRIAIEGGNSTMAVKLLGELFPGRAAALATAAAILENDGKVDDAVAMLEQVEKDHPKLAGEALKTLAGTLLRSEKYENAAAILQDVLAETPNDDLVRGQLVVATSFFDAVEAERLAGQLHPVNPGYAGLDGEDLEGRPPPRKRDMARTSKLGENGHQIAGAPSSDDDAMSTVPKIQGLAAGKSKKKKSKKKKKRLPKDYDPNGPSPDPERWLPKTLRSSHKKKKKNREANFRGAQGADAAAADAAGIRNAERSAARATEASTTSSAPQMPKGTKGKKKNRRR